MKKPKRTLYVSVRGGLCNRLNNIINGFYYYEKYSFNKICIIWLHNHHCEASFGQLFQGKKGVATTTTLNNRSKRALIIAGNQTFIVEGKGEHGQRTVKRVSRNLKKKYEAYFEGSRDCLLREDPFIHTNIPTEKVMEIINTIMPRPTPYLQCIINQFLVQNDLQPDTYIGVHIRRTDLPKQHKRPNSYYTEQIRKALEENKDQKFFLCSDDSVVERQMLATFPSNIIIRPKNKQPKVKRGKVHRSAQASQEGVIDLFLLSQASRIIGSVGTYSRLARNLVEARAEAPTEPLKKICFLTTIIANSYKEADKPPKFKRNKDYEYLLFTNLDPSLFDTSWTVRRIENEHIDSCPSNIIKSRYIKFMAWEYLQKVMGKSYDAIVYCDGIYTPKLGFDWQQLAKDTMRSGLVQKKHIRVARQECKILLKRGRKDSPQRIKGVIKWLESNHFPKGQLMTENCFFAYDPNNKSVTSTFKVFWNLFVTDITNRDQPLWSYFLWKRRLKPIIYGDKRWKFAFAPIDKKSIGFNQHHY